MLGLGAAPRSPAAQLSGGQRQRVAMGRAIVRRPALFLFDEPLSNLDAALRAQVRVDIRKLHDRLGATSVYVTHDQVEAMTLADVMFVLNKGDVEQAGAPLEIYARPATRFVAGFLGSPAMNFFDGTHRRRGRRASRCREAAACAPDRRRRASAARSRRARGDRRRAPARRARSPPRARARRSRSRIVEALGVESFAHGDARRRALRRPRRRATRSCKKGERIHVAFATVHLFDAGAGRAPARARRHERARSLAGSLVALLGAPRARRRRAPRAAASASGTPTATTEPQALEAVLACWKGAPVEALVDPVRRATSRSSPPRCRSARGPTSSSTRTSASATTAHRKIVAPVGDALEPGVVRGAGARRGDRATASRGPCRSRRSASRSTSTRDLATGGPARPRGVRRRSSAKLPRGAFPLAFEAKNAYYDAALLSAFGGAPARTDDHVRPRRAGRRARRRARRAGSSSAAPCPRTPTARW